MRLIDRKIYDFESGNTEIEMQHSLEHNRTFKEIHMNSEKATIVQAVQEMVSNERFQNEMTGWLPVSSEGQKNNKKTIISHVTYLGDSKVLSCLWNHRLVKARKQHSRCDGGVPCLRRGHTPGKVFKTRQRCDFYTNESIYVPHSEE